jgi:cell wall-associated NlpC family hydrolase
MDRRLTPANDRVAALSLRGTVQAPRYFEGTPRSVIRPVADLCATPAGARDRQLLLGTAVTVYEDREGWSFVQSARDGYVGYVPTTALGPRAAPTHRVATPATHAYRDEDIKSPDRMSLPFGAEVVVLDERRKFLETPQGFIPKNHLRPLDRPFADPVTVAQLFFGVPYLWGGNTTRGVDCSGLVQAAHLACGIACPADSDLQREGFGRDAEGPWQRGDLVFWKGHVGLMVDAETLIHANAHHMAVAYEPITAAITRVEAQEGSKVLRHKRL